MPFPRSTERFLTTHTMKAFVAGYRRAFPDAHSTVEDQVAEGDKVVTRWRARGTHRGPLGPIAVIQRGHWSVTEEGLVARDVVTQARALDGNTETHAIVKASAELIDAIGREQPGASEILRLDANRLTPRPLGVVDPPVIGCIRQA